MLEKIINKQLVWYSMFYNFNEPVILDINKDLKHYKLNKKDFNKVKFNIITNLCNNKNLEWNEVNNKIKFYPVDHLKLSIENYHFVSEFNCIDITLEDLISYYKEYYNITILNDNDTKYLKDTFKYEVDYSLPF